STASVKGCPCNYVGNTSGVHQITAHLMHRPTRQPWAPADIQHSSWEVLLIVRMWFVLAGDHNSLPDRRLELWLFASPSSEFAGPPSWARTKSPISTPCHSVRTRRS